MKYHNLDCYIYSANVFLGPLLRTTESSQSLIPFAQSVITTTRNSIMQRTKELMFHKSAFQ